MTRRSPIDRRWLIPVLFLGLWSFPGSGPGVAQPRAETARDVSIAVPPPVRTAEGFDVASSVGLFVGIRHFDDQELSEVPFAVDDAVDLAHLFALELELIPPGKVVLSLSGEPQKERSRARLQALRDAGAVQVPANQSEIFKQLDQQSKAAGRRGLFVAAFATHGFHEESGDFLVASHSRRRFIRSTGVDVFVQAKGYRTDAEKEGFSITWNGSQWVKKEGASWRDSVGSDHPVVHVSWNDAEGAEDRILHGLMPGVLEHVDREAQFPEHRRHVGGIVAGIAKLPTRILGVADHQGPAALGIGRERHHLDAAVLLGHGGRQSPAEERPGEHHRGSNASLRRRHHIRAPPTIPGNVAIDARAYQSRPRPRQWRRCVGFQPARGTKSPSRRETSMRRLRPRAGWKPALPARSRSLLRATLRPRAGWKPALPALSEDADDRLRPLQS